MDEIEKLKIRIANTELTLQTFWILLKDSQPIDIHPHINRLMQRYFETSEKIIKEVNDE